MTCSALIARRAAAVATAVALAVPLAFTPSSASAAIGAAPSAAQAAPQPRTQAGARAAAAAATEDYAAGDYGPFWDQWSSASKRIVSRANYVRRFQLCTPIAEGLPITVRKVTLYASSTRARVRVSRLGILFNYEFVYERGAWRYVLPADVAREYRTKSITRIVREERAAGACE